MESRKDFERFAVQYWGQQVFRGEDMGCHTVDGFSILMPEFNYLQLRSIESLMDEEYKHIANLYGLNPSILYGKEIIKSAFTDYGIPFSNSRSVVGWIQIIDYLRSIGILVPFDKYSIEQILEMGWAKIK